MFWQTWRLIQIGVVPPPPPPQQCKYLAAIQSQMAKEMSKGAGLPPSQDSVSDGHMFCMYYRLMRDFVGVLLAVLLKSNFEIVHLRLQFSRHNSD